ncbi:MAG: hypothetical protein ACP5G7_12310, partial [Anaerolineae bacterium]
MRGSRDRVLVAAAVIAVVVWLALRFSERAAVAPMTTLKATEIVAAQATSSPTLATAPVEGALAPDETASGVLGSG